METCFLSSEGRIGRMTFFVRIVALSLSAVGFSCITYSYFAYSFHHGEFATLGVFCSIVIGVIAKLAGLMQLLKRLRDMGKEAYLSLLMLFPGINILFLLYACIAPSKTDWLYKLILHYFRGFRGPLVNLVISGYKLQYFGSCTKIYLQISYVRIIILHYCA